MRSLLLLASLALASCSEWTPCPETVEGATGKACVGENECNYGGCLPGDWCKCEGGKWICYLSSCLPDFGLDLGVDAPMDLGPDATVLGQGDPCDPADDRCGAGLTCCMTGGGPPWIFDAAPPWPYTCIAPRSDGSCPPPPP